MRILAWLGGSIVAAGVLLFGGMMLLAEHGGEVVELHTTDASGATRKTRLWVVDDSGFSWLFAARPERCWLQHLRTRPEVWLLRGGNLARYRAVPVETDEARQHVLWLALKRYGLAFNAVALIHQAFLGDPPTEAVPIRLEPLEPQRSGDRP